MLDSFVDTLPFMQQLSDENSVCINNRLNRKTLCIPYLMKLAYFSWGEQRFDNEGNFYESCHTVLPDSLFSVKIFCRIVPRGSNAFLSSFFKDKVHLSKRWKSLELRQVCPLGVSHKVKQTHSRPVNRTDYRWFTGSHKNLITFP